MSKEINYNYAIVFYDIGEDRVQKVFKICKKYFKHHQKSVFRGHITPANLIAFKAEVSKKINKEYDFITIIQMISQADFKEETLGNGGKNSEDIFI
ncbi:MAG TPA: CRISPR-associated endonuclease Cas2 [Clostridiales bacterium]|nr:CRISPR-associated endonuclease Cas2 [Clostridiales bacterium]